MGEIKSSYEAALERMKERGLESEAKPLSDEQKQRISEIRSECAAKLAELDIMRTSELRKAADAEAVSKVEAHFAGKKSSVRREMEEQIESARRQGA